MASTAYPAKRATVLVLMRILHVVQGYTPAIGGTERAIQKISEKLVERHYDEVTVYTTNAYNCELFWRRDQPQLPVGTEHINGVTVRRFPVFNRFNRLRFLLAGGTYALHLPYNDWFRALHNGPLIPDMTGAIARSGAEVISASSFPLLHMHYALRAGRKARIPVVLFGGIHTGDHYGFERQMIYEAIRHADAYIANSTFERDYLAERGILQDKITVIGVGVDVEPFAHASGTTLRERLGWANSPVVAYVGQQVPHKGVDIVFEAVKQLWSTRPDICLLIAGARTTYSAIIESWLAQMNPEQRARVAILHNFPEADKPSIFAAADIVAYPSGQESFGIVYAEAWAATKPVIGARIGAVQAVITEGKDGILVKDRDVRELVAAIRTLIERPDLARQMGQAGYKKVLARYTWDLVADKFRDVYVRMIAQSIRTHG